jgi:NADH-ubiquinone oxidoreductase chain 3
LAYLLLLVGERVSIKLSQDQEKLSPFECGFTPKFSARIPFSIRFFLVTIIFLVFDVELILIFPLVPALFLAKKAYLFLSLCTIVFILIAGLGHEIFQGRLRWAN